jgi:hypothetical protein
VKLSNYRRMFEQDFSPEDRPLISKLGVSINSSFEELYNALNNKITIRDNISATIGEFTVTVDSEGIPKNKTSFKLENNQTIVEGLLVINVTGAKDSSILPTGGVFVSFVRNENFIIIQNIKGLEPEQLYKIKVIVLG